MFSVVDEPDMIVLGISPSLPKNKNEGNILF